MLTVFHDRISCVLYPEGLVLTSTWEVWRVGSSLLRHPCPLPVLCPGGQISPQHQNSVPAVYAFLRTCCGLKNITVYFYYSLMCVQVVYYCFSQSDVSELNFLRCSQPSVQTPHCRVSFERFFLKICIPVADKSRSSLSITYLRPDAWVCSFC